MKTVSISEIQNTDRTRKDLGDISALAKSIQAVALLHPIVVNSKMQLIAGARRLEALKLLNWKTVPVIVADRFDDAVKALEAERDENTCRKNLTPSEAVAMGARFEAMERPKAKQRQAHGKTAPGKNASGKLPEASEDTRDKVGSAVGLSGRSYEKAKAVVAAARENPQELGDLIDKMDCDGKIDRAYRELSRRKAVKKVAAAPTEKARIIYADPAFKYNDSRDALEGTTGATAHYPTMSISDLCALPVAEWSDDNAVLFLWVPSPLLFECEPVIKAWGFQYKASFVWDKVKHNLGHYNSVRHEFLLICTRGSCAPDNVKLFDSVQSIERTEHSKKPEEFRKIIETLYPHGKRLEMFARVKADGWESWSHEV